MAKLALVDNDQNILTSVAMTPNFVESALSEIDKSMSNMVVLDVKMSRMSRMDMLQGLLQKLACQFK